MKMNTEKTEVMNIGRDKRNITILIDGHQLKQVKEVMYLGSIISANQKNQ